MPRSRPRGLHRGRLAVASAGAVLAVVVLVVAVSAGGPPPLPPAGPAPPARAGDPFSFFPTRANDFVARATAGEAHVLFAKSPGGAVATARRVAALRALIEAAASGSGVDPGTLEGIVYLESAGVPDAIAGGDPVNAAGLTQIESSTGTALLGMRINLSRSRALTTAIDRAAGLRQTGVVARLQAERAKVDERFDPRKALLATVRYLQLAERRFGRLDLAIESYHMGIGNLAGVLAAYDGGAAVPYVRLYFDTAPNRHAAAYRLLSSFGDDSWTYYWRVLAAEQIMGLYRTDPAALRRLESLQTGAGSASLVLHPPDLTPAFDDPVALQTAYADHRLVRLPLNDASLGLAYDPGMGSSASKLGVTQALYRGLTRPALDALIELAARVRALSGATPLIVSSTVADRRYQQLIGEHDPPAADGWSFTIARRYVSPAQAAAFQAMLDRLQALNVIAWERYPAEIEVTVASDADRVIAAGA